MFDPTHAFYATGGLLILVILLLTARLQRIERKLDRLMRHVGASDTASAVPSVQAVNRGDAFPWMAKPATDTAKPGNHEIEELIRDGQKIAAIKRWREVYGVGLAEAKNAVEALTEEMKKR